MIGPLVSSALVFALTPLPVNPTPSVSSEVERRGAGGQVEALALYEVRAKGTLLRIDALTDTILRVRLAVKGDLAEDASWAVSPETRGRRVAVTRTATGFTTAALSVTVDPRTLALTVTDRAGRVIVADAAPPAIDGTAFTLRKVMPAAERYYGLGDKTGPLDRRGRSFVNWNTDQYGYEATTDPLYKSIPFYIGVGGAGGSYGLFLDNPRRSHFDFGHRADGVIELGASGGPIDYYIIAGPTTAEVVRGYGALTGTPPMLPRWALGYQQSRYSYMDEGEVRGIARRLRRDRVPADVIWLDIDYQQNNRPFTVNKTAFPDLGKLDAELERDGFKLVTIVDLHIANLPDAGYVPYDSGIAGDHFLKNPDGSVYTAPVWPGASVFPDVTRERTRMWWGDLFKGFVDMGIDGIWNDMNEPAIFETPSKTMPLDTRHRIDANGFAPRGATHAEVHNVYGSENARATYEGLLRLRPDARPFVTTRATYAGGQKYAVTWTGDNNSSWDHLKLSVAQSINLGLSGFTWTAVDIGGFTGGATPDLLTRWFQIGAFMPVFRSHAGKGSPQVEPWVDGDRHLAIRRKYIEERYRLLPYFDGLAEVASRLGDPVVRPVFYDYPAASGFGCDQSMAFTVGAKLLVAGNPRPESDRAYSVCLPEGGWYDYWSGRRVAVKETAADATLDRFEVTPRIEDIPVYVRAGAIIPRQPLVQSTGEVPNGPLELHVYPGDDCAGELYADDGATLGYARGDYLRQRVTCRVGSDGVEVAFGAREGSYQPWWREMVLVVHGGARPVRRTVPAPMGGERITLR